jgi:6,7-dimethyl-8-ribityllumazine synthase
MATVNKALSAFDKKNMPDLNGIRFGIIVSEWNNEITDALAAGCLQTLKELGVKKKNITHISVPGSYELPGAAKILVEHKKLDAVICLGCIIKGETRHDEYIANAVAEGLMYLNTRYPVPFVFGVLTTESFAQAQARAGGGLGNKGVEAVITAVRMIEMKQKLG